MANTALIFCDYDDASKKTLPVAEKPPSTLPETSANDAPPSLQQTTAPGLSLVWKSLNSKEFQTKLPALSSSHGVWEPNDSVNRALRNGKSSVVNNKLIRLQWYWIS